jgi:hypothetical protein
MLERAVSKPRDLRSGVNAMNTVKLLVIVLFVISLLAAPGRADVFSYECTSFPPEGGWQLVQALCDPQQWLVDGWLFHHVEQCPGYPPPAGQQFDYTRDLADFAGEEAFFIEWRVQTDGDASEIIGVAPASVSAWGFSGVWYHATMARDQIRLYRDANLPILWVEIAAGVPHTYRVELLSDQLYTWFVDGQVIDSGVPEGPYPTWDSAINWRTKSWYLPNTTKWDYIRYGTIPEPGSGDYDSDGDIDDADLAAFHDCLLGPDADGPGCSWADMNGEGIVNGADIPAFVDALLAPGQPTHPGPGVQSISFDAAPRE